MQIFKKKNALIHCLSLLKEKNKLIGFVPTMGALHKGHQSLVKNSIENNDVTVVSIFVNPTQFNNPDDLKKYPKTLKEDLELLENIGCDFVFIPTVEEIYAQAVVSKSYSFDGIENQMEGKFRKGHFDGVATIVQAFFEIIKPDTSYFGEKDFQQLQVVKKLTEKENIPVKVIGCPIYRENDGLAMSSRNIRLSKEQRSEAPFIYQTLKKVVGFAKTKSVKDMYEFVKNEFATTSLELEYFTIAEENTLAEVSEINFDKKNRAFIAVNIGGIRLIDNISL
ncbi:Pantothenate synthetase [Polaribacter huanghezhanensis]|uniref:pantoate--beta-alanine ligase n=1 Tax=Polaribacter huanghezhanensis TaxID=1354726 RepID=UPI0026489821|nr:pantoate--beta-alanine ligase [Polaribacter huanghezhanensis]WKD85407.1 Pantothenate synthetase [Polaribacter huanghezhanensis]